MNHLLIALCRCGRWVRIGFAQVIEKMKQILLSIRRIWTKAVFWFAYFFRIEYKTANTTLLVAIVPAMIAVSRGVTYLWQCLYYGWIFNIPISLIQTTDSIWVSFFKGILCVLIAVCGILYIMLWEKFLASTENPLKIKYFVLYFASVFLVFAAGAAVFFINKVWVLKFCPYIYLFLSGSIIGKIWGNKTITLEEISLLLSMTFLALLMLISSITIFKPYPITTTEAGNPAAIVYLTNNTAVLEEVEFEQDEKGNLTLIIHKNNQEIAASVTALTYEYQNFYYVKVVSDLIEHDNVKQDTIVNTYYMIMRYLVASHNQEQLNFSLAPYEMPPRP